MSLLTPSAPGSVTLTLVDGVSSLDPSICGIPICGDGHVCGGTPFLAGAVCVSPDLTIVGTFLCAERLVTGNAFTVSSAAPRILELVPSEVF